MSNYDAFRQSAINAKPIRFNYQGHVREACVHVVGTKNGYNKALTYQYGGTSSSGLPPAGQWRCIFIDQADNVEEIKGNWHTGDNHSQPQTCVQEIDVQVFLDASGKPYAQVA